MSDRKNSDGEQNPDLEDLAFWDRLVIVDFEPYVIGSGENFPLLDIV